MTYNNSDIVVLGARANNLRGVDVRIPRGRLTVVTGLSGSGKSSLAFDTLYAEGQRRYIDTFGAYARGFLGAMERPDVDQIRGLSPVISIEQKTINRNPRSTVGTQTEIYDFLRLLYARAGTAYSYMTGEPMIRYTDEEVLRSITERYASRSVLFLAPKVRNRKGHYRELFEQLRQRGYLYVRVDGVVRDLTRGMKTDRYATHNIEVVVDKLVVRADDDERLRSSVAEAMRQGDGLMMVVDKATDEGRYYSRRLMCPTSGIAYSDPAPNKFSFNSPEGACPCCKGLGMVSVDEELISFDNDEEPMVVECPECKGLRLSREALAYKICDKNIAEVASLDLRALRAWIDTSLATLPERQRTIASEIMKEISRRIDFMLAVGLDYLSLSRPSATLSGGESQRIRLATQIGSQLVGVVYILDEPSIGLHQRDNDRLISSLKELRDMGRSSAQRGANTVIVVEHDRDMMLAADYIVDIGPGAGVNGGHVVYQGTPTDMLRHSTLTADYLNGLRTIPLPSSHRLGNGYAIKLHGARGNNLKSVEAVFPLAKLIVVTGVSGSGKSSLVNATLRPLLSKLIHRAHAEPLPYDRVEGLEMVDKVVCVDQTPLGRTPRSNAATYTGVLSDIRRLFVALPEAKIRGYKAGRFSFNVSGGRCEACGGAGYKTIEMKFLPDVTVPCDTCNGKRYNRETLEVKYKGLSIADVLDMTIDQAVTFFQAVPDIRRKIKALQDVGLGYITLGQPCTTLSGGESQRVKLAAELAKRDTGSTVYILDEPTTGLHFEDIRILMTVLERLVDKGNTVIVIEHNMDVIKRADHIIDMGPEGGSNGGEILSCGTPEEVALSPLGFTPQYLLREIENCPREKSSLPELTPAKRKRKKRE